jgi:uncharacterized glyoxalase superfamily protein PhnB
MSTFDAMTIQVTDLERSLAFYRLIGLTIPEAMSRSFATLQPTGPTRIDWSTTPGCATGAGDRIAMGVRCRDADELDRIHLALVDAGHEVQAAPHVAPWGARVCRAVDPDGHIVELYVALP